MSWANDDRDVQVDYQGRMLTAMELTQIRGILAKAADVAPSAVRLLPYPGA